MTPILTRFMENIGVYLMNLSMQYEAGFGRTFIMHDREEIIRIAVKSATTALAHAGSTTLPSPG